MSFVFSESAYPNENVYEVFDLGSFEIWTAGFLALPAKLPAFRPKLLLWFEVLCEY